MVYVFLRERARKLREEEETKREREREKVQRNWWRYIACTRRILIVNTFLAGKDTSWKRDDGDKENR